MKQVTLPLNLAHRRTRKREFLESMERAVPWPALLALIAPRPFLILGGESGRGAADGDRSWPLIEVALPVWKLYGEPTRIGLLNHRQGHSISPESFERIAEWLETYLK